MYLYCSDSWDAFYQGSNENPVSFFLLSHPFLIYHLTLCFPFIASYTFHSLPGLSSDFPSAVNSLWRRCLIKTLLSWCWWIAFFWIGQWARVPWELLLICSSLCRSEGHTNSGRLAGECTSWRIQGWCGPIDHSYRWVSIGPFILGEEVSCRGLSILPVCLWVVEHLGAQHDLMSQQRSRWGEELAQGHGIAFQKVPGSQSPAACKGCSVHS